MRAFANFILRGRLQALLITVFASALTLMLPLFSHLAGGVLSLVTLRNGLREGALIALGAALALAALGYVSALDAGLINIIILSMLLLMWAPVLIAANVLRVTRSIDLTLMATGGITAATMLVFYVYIGDVTAWWRSALQDVLMPLLQQLDVPVGAGDQELLIDSMSRVMTGVLAATVFFTTMINLFIGRYLQALLFNPGGFGEEFRSLRLGRPMGIAAALMLVLASFTGGWLGNLAVNLMFLVGAMYSLQGLALAHAVVAITKAHSAWLIVLYILMLLALPQVALVLSAAGFADSWLDMRTKLKKRGGST